MGRASGSGFFFSSRRRHTSWTGDWSSDVCSSDLESPQRFPDRRARDVELLRELLLAEDGSRRELAGDDRLLDHERDVVGLGAVERSEERRVGKECTSRWGAAYDEQCSTAERLYGM